MEFKDLAQVRIAFTKDPDGFMKTVKALNGKQLITLCDVMGLDSSVKESKAKAVAAIYEAMGGKAAIEKKKEEDKKKPKPRGKGRPKGKGKPKEQKPDEPKSEPKAKTEPEKEAEPRFELVEGKGYPLASLIEDPTIKGWIPEMSKTEMETLQNSIATWGLKEELSIREDGVILDGHSRTAAMKALNWEYIPKDKVVVCSMNTDAKALVYWKNIPRRHLSDVRKLDLFEEISPKTIEAQLERVKAETAGKKLQKRDALAKLINVSPATVERYMFLKRYAPDFLERVLNKQTTLWEAKQLVAEVINHISTFLLPLPDKSRPSGKELVALIRQANEKNPGSASVSKQLMFIKDEDGKECKYVIEANRTSRTIQQLKKLPEWPQLKKKIGFQCNDAPTMTVNELYAEYEEILEKKPEKPEPVPIERIELTVLKSVQTAFDDVVRSNTTDGNLDANGALEEFRAKLREMVASFEEPVK